MLVLHVLSTYSNGLVPWYLYPLLFLQNCGILFTTVTSLHLLLFAPTVCATASTLTHLWHHSLESQSGTSSMSMGTPNIDLCTNLQSMKLHASIIKNEAPDISTYSSRESYIAFALPLLIGNPVTSFYFSTVMSCN